MKTTDIKLLRNEDHFFVSWRYEKKKPNHTMKPRRAVSHSVIRFFCFILP